MHSTASTGKTARSRLARLATVALAGVLFAGGASSTAAPRFTRVAWDGRTNGGAQFFTDGPNVWILGGSFLRPNVWRVDPKTLMPKRTPLPNMSNLVTGEGRLWGIRRSGARARVYYVDIERNYALREKRLPQRCSGTDLGHLVFRSRLWFRCDFDGHYVVFSPEREAAARRLRIDGDLIVAAGALWLVDLYHSVRCLEGPCKGRPFGALEGAWDVDGDTAWAFRSAVNPREGVFDLVRFRSRAVIDFSVKVPRRMTRVPELRVVGDEIWLLDSPRFAIARYSTNDPTAPPRLLQLPGVSRSAEAGWPVETAAGRAWIGVRNGRRHEIFRTPVPRDPPALRRMRATLVRELERDPGRLGAKRTDGAPLHASCESRKVGNNAAPPGFRAVPVFRCVVRFPDEERYFCAAIIRARLVVDRTHNACRD